MLACPHCGCPLDLRAADARCPSGHSFDRGRGGYLNLLVAGRIGSTAVAGDAPDALLARRRFLSAGHYDPIRRALADAVGTPPGPVLDVGCGEGSYVSHLEVPAARYGLDVSKAAVQMAARAFPETQFVVGNAYRLPVLDHSAGVVISVFAPHPLDEFDRVLRPGGWWVTVTPGPRHLQELRGPTEGDAARKVEGRRQRRSVPPPGSSTAQRVEFELELSADAASDLFLMTPLRYAAPGIRGPATVTVDVWVASSRAEMKVGPARS